MYHWMKIGLVMLLGSYGMLWGQATQTPANFNLTLEGQLPYVQDLTDIWGYVDQTGIEYALVGAVDGVSIVSLANPAQPTEVLFIPDVTSTHRDLKTWGTHAYVTAERGRGLLVIDLSPLPQGTPTYRFATPSIPLNGINYPLVSAHNLYIDEKGYCYIAGSGQNNGGVIILDVHTQPDTPRYVGAGLSIYAHDVYARGDTLWTSDINDGFFSVYDVTDRTNPQRLAFQYTPFTFTHNAWISDDGQTLFTTDEVAGAWVVSYDVSDLSDIQELDRYRTPTSNTIPHNTHTLHDYQVVSYYTDGLIVLDNSRPDNLVEVARYDTYLTDTRGFAGAWGAYPYFPSGLMVVSDMQTGLYVLRPSYQRACWLEGLVTDQATGAPLFGVAVDFLQTSTTEQSRLNGVYKTGIGLAGTYQVRFSKAGYLSQTFTLNLSHGVVTTQNVQLVPAVPYTLTGQVVDQPSNTGIPNAPVYLKSHLYEYTTTADANGQFQLVVYPDDVYEVIAGQWGHREGVFALPGIDSTTAQGQIYPLERGYKDDFMFDYNWLETGTAQSGKWAFEQPDVGVVQGIFPRTGDLPQDIGTHCLLTGYGINGGNVSQGGYTQVWSPRMDLTTYQNPQLHFHYFFFALPPLGADSLALYLTNGIDTTCIWSTTSSIRNRQWSSQQTLPLKDYLPLTNNMQVYFEANDGGRYSAVEAMVDGFEITEDPRLNTALLETPETIFQVFPNPFTATVVLKHQQTKRPDSILRVRVHNALGQLVETHRWPAPMEPLELGATWQSGLYFITVGNQTQTVIKVR